MELWLEWWLIQSWILCRVCFWQDHDAANPFIQSNMSICTASCMTVNPIVIGCHQLGRFVMIVLRVRGKIITSVLCSIVSTVQLQCTHMNRPNSCLLVIFSFLWVILCYCLFVYVFFCCVRFSLVLCQETGWENFSKMTYFVSSGM